MTIGQLTPTDFCKLLYLTCCYWLTVNFLNEIRWICSVRYHKPCWKHIKHILNNHNAAFLSGWRRRCFLSLQTNEVCHNQMKTKKNKMWVDLMEKGGIASLSWLTLQPVRYWCRLGWKKVNRIPHTRGRKSSEKVEDEHSTFRNLQWRGPEVLPRNIR